MELLLPDSDAVAEDESDADGVADALPEPEGDAEADAEAVVKAELLALPDADAEADTVAVLLALCVEERLDASRAQPATEAQLAHLAKYGWERAWLAHPVGRDEPGLLRIARRSDAYDGSPAADHLAA